jgi:uncharacterized protein YjbJ (UPF0337 family)
MTCQRFTRRSIHLAALAVVVATALSSAACTGNREKDKGEANITKGRLEDAAGKVTGDSDERARGAVDQTKGHLQKAVGSVEQAVKGH